MITELKTFGHLWARASTGVGNWSSFIDLTSAPGHAEHECVYASCASYSDDNLYLIYQQDTEPGNAVRCWRTCLCQ